MRIVLRVLLCLIAGIFLLLIGVIIYINSPMGQNFIRAKAEAYLSNKLKTKVHIGFLGYGLPKYVVVKDVLLLDQVKDTLLAANLLKVDIAMLQLLHKKIDVQQIVVDGLHSHIYRNIKDTNYNFSYIIAAFASTAPPDTVKAKKTGGTFVLSLDCVKLTNIHVRLNDYTGGMQLAVTLDELELKMKELDINKLMFHIQDLTIAGLQSSFSKDTSYLRPSTAPSSPTALQLIADNVNMKQVAFQYKDVLGKLFFGIEAGSLQLQLNQFGLAEEVIDIKKLDTKNTNVVLSINLAAKTTTAIVDTLLNSAVPLGWCVKAQAINFENVGYKMDDISTPHQDTGIDYVHLNLTKAALVMQNFRYNTDTIIGSIKHFTGAEQCGLEVSELKTDFSYNQQGAVLNNLYFKTPNTTLQNHIEVHYPSVTEVVKRLQLLQLDLRIVNSIVALQDVLIFVPQLHSQQIFSKYKAGKINVDGTITGFLNDLNIAHFSASGMGNTELVLQGKLGGMPEIKDLTYNFNISKFQSSKKDIALFVPDSLLASVNLPDRFGSTGLVSGNLNDYNANLYVATTDGRAYIKGMIATSPGKNHERYNMLVKTDRLNIGKLLKQDSVMGEVTINATIKGESFDVKTMAAQVDATITSANIKGYNYHNITMYGKVAGKKGDINIRSLDKNIQLLLTGSGDFNNQYPAVKADIKIDSIDFRALKLYKTELRASGVIHIDCPEMNPDYPKGELIWWQPSIVADGKKYLMDSIYVASRPNKDSGQNIFADLNVMQARLSGNTPLTKMAAIISAHINKHFSFAGQDSVANVTLPTPTLPNKKVFVINGQAGVAGANNKLKMDTVAVPANYHLQLSIGIIDKPLLHSLLPGLTSFEAITIKASVDPNSLVFNATIPKLVYSSTVLQNGKVQLKETDSGFIYNATADLLQESNLVFWYANVYGKLQNSSLLAAISLSDHAHKEQFALAATMQQSVDSQIIHLLPGLKLNYNTWAVAQPNRIVMAKGGFYISNFEISNDGQQIKAQSDQPLINTPIKIDINNFNLSNITNAISKTDTLLAEGVLEGNITLQKITPLLQLTTNLQIKNLIVMKDTVGDLQIEVNNKTAQAYDAKLSIKGQGNDILLAGAYYTQTTNGNDFDFKLDVNALKLHSFETIAQSELHNSTGFVRGNLKIQGTIAVPDVTGELRTDNLTTTITRLNEEFKMPAEKIVFTTNTITFPNFTIADSKGNKAVVTGDIGTKNLPELALNLKIDAKKWQALHSTIKDNKEYYGDLFLTTNLSIKGTSNAPNTDGNIFILPGTKLTVANTEDVPQLQNSNGIVKFVNMRDTARQKYLVVGKKDSVKHKLATGTEINVNITVPKEAEFSLIIDEASGDFLTVKGEAYLNTSVSAGGVISLSGNYALHGGVYQLNYNFIKRKFLIQDGSSMTFAGDPIKGTTLDVTAVYEAKIAPYDLVMRQVSDPVQLNYYKQVLPFNIDMHLKGQIMQPLLTFDVILPENKVYPLTPDQIELVQGKLSQLRTDTTALNKQVFATLILGRFVSDDPFSSSSPGLGFTALQSVSTFIGEQLNQAAGKLVKGVDISVDLQTAEDYTTGSMQQRTDLNLAASKRLLNDRLKLTLGNDFELQGPQTNNQQSSYVPNNLAADYLLTPDGRYTLRTYRKNYDEGVLQGYITQTGLDFIVSVDYNNLMYVLKKKKKNPAPKKDETK